MEMKQRTILITGGTSGIGRELARRLTERGNQVIVTGRDQDKLEEVKRELPGVEIIKSDVADAEAIVELQRTVTTRFPAVDTLINNAGIMRNINLNDTRDLSDLTREIDINLSGPIRMVQQFLPHLKTRPSALIVNVSSGLAFVPFPLSPVYSATKAGMHAFTQVLRAQLKDTHVTVVELAPPGVETALFRKEFPELKEQKGMDVKVLAQHALEGIEAGSLEIRPGQANLLRVMSRVAPQLAFNQMVKMTRVKTS